MASQPAVLSLVLLTSAWLPGDRILLHLSHFRQKRCQFFPRELTFSARTGRECNVLSY